jgi:hypothetical protein
LAPGDVAPKPNGERALLKDSGTLEPVAAEVLDLEAAASSGI